MLCCARGHSFDLARAGYCNLLQPQDRRSSTPGDDDETVRARARWLERGLGLPLARALAARIEALALPSGAAVLDAGCGDGYFLSRLAAGRTLDACGVDLSLAAIRRAARRMPGATWLVANADRRLPVPDGSLGLVLSIFGRRNGPELARALAPAGRLIAVVPGPDDLIELREAVAGRRVLLDRADGAIAALAPYLALDERHRSSFQSRLDESAIQDALRLTYRGARTRERERAARLTGLDATLSSEILVFRISPGAGRHSA